MASLTRTLSQTVRVWDLATRLFHWALVALLMVAYITSRYPSDATLYWHRVNGYALLTLLLFRLVWGFVGSSTSRFTSFFPWPRAVIGYATALARGNPPHLLGHNPLGGLLIIVMLAALGTQAITGLFTSDDSFAEGPMVRHASERLVGLASFYHAKGFWIILGLALLHVIANLVYQYGFKQNLIGAMIDGVKPRASYRDRQEADLKSNGRAAFVLVSAAAIVLACLFLAGQNPLH